MNLIKKESKSVKLNALAMLDGDLSRKQSYRVFEKLGPAVYVVSLMYLQVGLTPVDPS